MKDDIQQSAETHFLLLASEKGIEDPGYYDVLLALVNLIAAKKEEKGGGVLTLGISGAQGQGKSTLA